MPNKFSTKARPMFRAVLIMLVAIAAISCDSNSVEPTKPDAGRDAGAGHNGGGTGATGGERATCFVDFPCSGVTAKCVGRRQLQPYHTVSCREVCGERPCSGGSCKPIGELVDCPDGHICRMVQQGGGLPSAECMVEVRNDGGTCRSELDAGDSNDSGCPDA